MSSGRDAGQSQRIGSPPARLVRVWRDLPHERRLAALACVGLFLTLFLPWYQETVFANGVSTLRSASSSLTGWGAFSFVEAAVLLVAAGVLVLLFVRAEGRAFHVPGGDGGVITAAGLWTCALIVWRIFDKQGTSREGQIAYTSGIEWGIFVALAVAALLAYAGSLTRLAHEPEPLLPGEPGSGGRTVTPAPRRGWLRRGNDEPRRRTTSRAYPGPDMEVDDDWTQELRARRAPASAGPAPPDASEAPAPPNASEAPTRRVRPSSISAPPQPQSGGRVPAAPDPRLAEPDPRPAEPETRGARPDRPARALDRSEIQELELEEPPTARLGRSAPATPPESEAPTERQRARRPDASDDQLTIRLDRPD
ncbi:MAG: hypothetical protein ACXVRW_08640 [Solirubrobacteraceae bacterium]